MILVKTIAYMTAAFAFGFVIGNILPYPFDTIVSAVCGGLIGYYGYRWANK